jgi:hypothetical protein
MVGVGVVIFFPSRGKTKTISGVECTAAVPGWIGIESTRNPTLSDMRVKNICPTLLHQCARKSGPIFAAKSGPVHMCAET